MSLQVRWLFNVVKNGTLLLQGLPHSAVDMEDLELPPQPQQPVARPRPSLLTRKRTLDEYHDDHLPSAASSDPALFSGDEAIPGAEDYSQKRKKKMYTGSWWNHRVKANKDDKKREFRRNFDSGIFMGSEGSEPLSSDSIGSLEEELIQDQQIAASRREYVRFPSVFHSKPHLRTFGLPSLSTSSETAPEHVVASQIIQKCLDEGSETVDLSALGLNSLPAEIVTLTTLAKQTILGPGMLEHGENLEARLQLYIANNSLRRVPRQVLELSNLRLLSLRQNNIRHLPPGMRNLGNLETLNIAGNKITHMPFEVIELVRFHRLRSIASDPNPWAQRPHWRTVGTPVRWVRPKAEMHLNRWQPLPTSPRLAKTQPSTSSSSAVPSLMETALRSLSRLDTSEDLRPYMPAETPFTVLNALEAMHNVHLDGGHVCSRCGRTIVQSQVELLEWWDVRPAFPSQRDPNDSSHANSIGQQALDAAWPVRRMLCRLDCVGDKNSWCDDVQRLEPPIRDGEETIRIEDDTWEEI